MNRASQRSLIERLLVAAPEPGGSKAIENRRPLIECLEDRTLLSTITWDTTDHPNGGAWDTPGNWQGGVVPGTSDNAVIDLTGTGTVTTGTSDSVLSLTTNSSTTVSVSNGSLTLGAATSSIGGPITVSSNGTLVLSGTALIGTGTVTDAGHLTASNSSTALSSITMASGSALNLGYFTVQSGATLSVSAGASVTIAAATTANTYTTLSDNGTLSFATGDTMNFGSTYPNYYYGSQIVVGSGGLFQANGTTFKGNGTAYTQIVVQSGGNLQASTSTFAIGQLNFNIGAVVAAGYLSGDAFNLPLVIPAIDVQYLSGTNSSNLQFQTIYIQPDTLVSGQSVALTKIGTQNTSNLNYVFPGNFTINQGASLSVGPNVTVTIAAATTANTYTTLTDNGTLSFATGDTMNFASTIPTTTTARRSSSAAAACSRPTAPLSTQRHRLHPDRRPIRRKPPGQHQHLRHRPAQLQHRRRRRRGLPVRRCLQPAAVHPRHRRAVPLGDQQQQPAVPDHLHPAGHAGQRPVGGARPRSARRTRPTSTTSSRATSRSTRGPA